LIAGGVEGGSGLGSLALPAVFIIHEIAAEGTFNVLLNTKHCTLNLINTPVAKRLNR